MAGFTLDCQSKFDAYAASVPVGVKMLRDTLEEAFSADAKCVPARALHSFKEAVAWQVPESGEMLATMMWGGVNPHPHVSAQSDPSIRLANLLRSTYPDHRVARLDVAIDMGPEGIFDECFRAMAATSRRFERLKGSKVIPDDPEDGSTYYLGTRGSPLYVRLYEKDKQLAKLTGDRVWRCAPFRGWTRLELEVRPEKAFKAAASRMPPEAFWGCSPWTRDLASNILSLNPEAISMKPTRIADHERAMRALAAQYGSTLRRHMERLGSDEEFLDDLKRRLGLGIAEAA